jgi:polysaccharide biosynthesis protein PslH
MLTNDRPIRTLFITRYIPYPPIGGSALRNWQNINTMMKLGTVAVFSITHNFSSKLKDEPEFPPGVDLWIHTDLEPLDKNKFWFQDVEYWLNIYKHSLSDLMYSNAIAQKLEKMLAQFQPDLVILAELALYSYFAKIKNKKYKIIYDAHNIEVTLRKDLGTTKKDFKSIIRQKILNYKIQAIERDLVENSHAVWTCSKSDALALQRIYGERKPSHISVVPNCLDVGIYDDIRLEEYELPHGLEKTPWTILFSATFSYLPNQTAAQLLIEEIFPFLQQKYPNSRLILAGKDPTAVMIEAAKRNSNIVVTGLVKDIKPYLAASSIVVVPLNKGSGTRLKILEAFAAGRLVISTSKGAEGLKAEDGKHILVRDSVDEIVAGAIAMIENPDLARQIAQNAYELVKTEYSWETASKEIKANIKKLFFS